MSKFQRQELSGLSCSTGISCISTVSSVANITALHCCIEVLIHYYITISIHYYYTIAIFATLNPGRCSAFERGHYSLVQILQILA